jgi:hypothetical protein
MVDPELSGATAKMRTGDRRSPLRKPGPLLGIRQPILVTPLPDNDPL